MVHGVIYHLLVTRFPALGQEDLFSVMKKWKKKSRQQKRHWWRCQNDTFTSSMPPSSPKQFRRRSVEEILKKLSPSLWCFSMVLVCSVLHVGPPSLNKSRLLLFIIVSPICFLVLLGGTCWQIQLGLFGPSSTLCSLYQLKSLCHLV